MKQRHVLEADKPEWVDQQTKAGNTVIHNAPRPITGDATEDSWSLPFVSGRHYAALNPNGPNFSQFTTYNERMDAIQLVYVTEEVAQKAGLAYYREMYKNTRVEKSLKDPKWLDRYRREIINRGLDTLNGYD